METLTDIQKEKTTKSTSNFDNLTVYVLIPQKENKSKLYNETWTWNFCKNKNLWHLTSLLLCCWPLLLVAKVYCCLVWYI